MRCEVTVRTRGEPCPNEARLQFKASGLAVCDECLELVRRRHPDIAGGHATERLRDLDYWKEGLFGPRKGRQAMREENISAAELVKRMREADAERTERDEEERTGRRRPGIFRRTALTSARAGWSALGYALDWLVVAALAFTPWVILAGVVAACTVGIAWLSRAILGWWGAA